MEINLIVELVMILLNIVICGQCCIKLYYFGDGIMFNLYFVGHGNYV